MSVYSMTGYASVVASVPDHVSENTEDSDTPAVSRKGAGGSVGAELRSVNSRFLDLSFKLPDEFRALEPAFRDILMATFKRGKIELRLAAQRSTDTAWPQPQPDQLHTLARMEGMVQNWLPKAGALSVNEVLNWCRNATPAVKLDEAALEAVRQCVDAMKEARAVEGQRMVAVLKDRLKGLRELAAQAEPLVPQAVLRQQERFLQRYQDALQAVGGSVTPEAAQERALAEAAAYALRIDVDEEVQRLKAHLDEIERLIKKGGEVGKRLDFLIQELHREANTLGSKAAALELTQISVGMKVLIEQMREQVQNIE
ncbi:MAG TPA: YicC/YloC family endoribonuclease [Aquabacterium sp.]|uniref:YicC/YloC family endoribonuclease n=1 Tax=Aquabacterium sp. TaxID=1872578 RepID=UPI002E31077E|nr:YicC/YloC family endoribonuclease [Aquabacterium sp.]HEX5373663.1 YicC/YloC family endoribonuclease [Aquabacterium sp.]